MSFHKVPLEDLSKMMKNTLMENFEIEITEVGDDFLKAKMPVTHRTVQPQRILHGGASVAFAESLGSVAGLLSLPNANTHAVVGLEINANHIRPVKEGGWIFGTCSPLHVGRSTMVFQISIENEAQKTVCISRITLAVVPL